MLFGFNNTNSLPEESPIRKPEQSDEEGHFSQYDIHSSGNTSSPNFNHAKISIAGINETNKVTSLPLLPVEEEDLKMMHLPPVRTHSDSDAISHQASNQMNMPTIGIGQLSARSFYKKSDNALLEYECLLEEE